MMRKILTFLVLAAVCSLGAATNYALRSNGSGFAGDVNASRAVDGKAETYWGYDPYPKAFVLQLKNIYSIDKLRLVCYKTGVYTFKAEYSTDNVTYKPLVEGVCKGTFEKSFPAVPVQFVRLTMLHNKTNKGVHVCELELWGPDGQKGIKNKSVPQERSTTIGRSAGTVQNAVRFKPVKITGSSFFTAQRKTEWHGPELTGDGKIGDFNFYWASDFKNKAPAPHWITFDFGRKITFNAVKLDMVERYNFSVLCNDFKIEYFDGKEWKILKNVTGYTSKFFAAMRHKDPEVRYTAVIPDSHPVFYFPAVTGSKVRFSTTDTIARLDEMSVLLYKERPKAKVIPAPRAFNDGIMRYSFAPRGAELMPGFVRPPLKGKGRLFFVDRGHPDQLRRYFAAGFGEKTLSVPVKTPGIYQIFIMGGDQFSPVKGSTFTVNGKVFRLPGAPGNHFPREIFTVDAVKSIDITFKGNWLINSVVIFPLEKEKEFRSELTKIIIGANHKRFKADPQPDHTAPFTASAADVKRGFVNFTTPIDKRIFMTTTPKKEECIKVIKAQSATDALKAVTTNFRFLKHIPDFKVTYSGALKATLHPVKNWLQRTSHKGSGNLYWRIPEILEENSSRYALKETTQQYYLLFDISGGTKPGLYKCKLTVTGKGIPATVIPVEFTVLPFQLEKMDSRQYGAMYTADYARPFLTLKSDPAFDRARLVNMRKYNMNSILYPYGKFTTGEEMKKLYLLVNKRLDECGYPRFPMAWHNQNFTVEQVKFIQKMVKETGLREILYYPVDEPHFGKRHIAEKMYPLVKSVPGTRSYSTVSQQDVDSFGKHLDFRTYMITGYAKFEPERIAEECRRENAHFYWYSNAAREYPDANRYKAGYFAWKCGGTGQLYWAYDNAGGDQWNDFDGRANDHNAVYIIDNKIFSTIQWEGIREGLDDLRYIYMLEKLIKKYPAAPAVNSAKALLAKIRKDTCVDLNAYQKRFGKAIDVHHYCWWTPEKMELYRNAIIAEIMKFPQK